MDCRIARFPESTRTANEAAAAVGCEVARIAKSIVLRRLADEIEIVVLASGGNRVSLERVGSHVGGEVAMADARFVRDRTGFAIGGVPPVGHRPQAVVLMDEDLWLYSTVWAAAGSPYAVFEIEPETLARAAGAERATIKEES